MKNTAQGECRFTPAVQEALDWAQQEAGYHVDMKQLLSHLRYARLVRIRRLAMWRLRTENRKSFPWIAKAIGLMDHATVMHHIQCENEARGLPKDYPLNVWRIEEDQALTANIDIIESQIKAGQNQEDVAYQWRVPLSKMRAALARYRREKLVGFGVLHTSESHRPDRIASQLVGA